MISIYINNESLELNESTKVTLSKKVEDLQNPDKRSATHSYTIKVPRSKKNERIFKGVSNIFVENKFNVNDFDAYILAGNIKILEGFAKITKIDQDNYSILIYDSLVTFFETIQDLNLQDLEFGEVALFYKQDYDDIGDGPYLYYNDAGYYITTHNNKDLTSDSTVYQFPFIYYNAFHLEDSIDLTEGCGHDLIDAGIFTDSSIDFTTTHYDFLIGSTKPSGGTGGRINYQYYNHFPPALYVISVLKKIINDAGWSINSSILQDKTDFAIQFKKLIIPFTGDTDIWNTGNGITDVPDGVDPDTGIYNLYYKLEAFLPDMTQAEFIKELLLMFNLYLSTDIQTKTIYIEPYDNFFLDNEYAYDLNNTLKDNTFSLTPIEEEDRNINISYAVDDSDGGLLNQKFKQSLKYINKETSENSKDIELKFAPTYFREINIYNVRRFDGGTTLTANTAARVAIPYISASSPSDGQGILWYNRDNTDIYEGAGPAAFDPSVMNYSMTPRILKYEGLVNMNTGDTDVDAMRNLLWTSIKGRTGWRMAMNQCSFFSIGTGQYPSEIDYNERIYEYIKNDDINRTGSTLNLCFGEYPEYAIDSGATYPNEVGLYNLFYLSKYANSESSNNLSVNCNINEEDYIKLVPTIPVRLDDIYYTILNIKNYNVNSGDVTLELKRKSRNVIIKDEVIYSPEIIDDVILTIDVIYVGAVLGFKQYDVKIYSKTPQEEDYDVTYTYYHSYYEETYSDTVTITAGKTVGYRGDPNAWQNINTNFTVTYEISEYLSGPVEFVLGDPYVYVLDPYDTTT